MGFCFPKIKLKLNVLNQFLAAIFSKYSKKQYLRTTFLGNILSMTVTNCEFDRLLANNN
jgi:hypothetical protein